MIAGIAKMMSAILIKIASTKPPNHPEIAPKSTPITSAVNPLKRPKATVFLMA